MKKISKIFIFCLLFFLFTGCGNEKDDKKYIEVYKSKEGKAKTREDSLEGVHVFSYGNTEDVLAIEYYEGFHQVMKDAGEKSAFIGTLEISSTAQIELLEDLIKKKPATITLCGLGDEGYEDVFQKAQEAGIPVFSVNGLVAAPYRVTHFDGVGLKNLSSSLIHLSYLISQKIEYNPQLPIEDQIVSTSVAKNKGKKKTKTNSKSVLATPINVACLVDVNDSMSETSIVGMQTQLQDILYANKMNPDLSVYYYNPKTDNLEDRAGEILDENIYDVVIGLTPEITKGLVEYRSQNADLSAKITGIVDSEDLDAYMGEEGSAVYDSICPYLFYDKTSDVGVIMANAVLQYRQGTYTAEPGSEIIVPAYDLYEER
ncbi:MAG TPA: substrate-binding domain-containing protein, partial [Lachnospiraceae bacterium]